MKFALALISACFVSLAAQADYVQRLGNVDRSEAEQKKLDNLQIILLNSSEVVFTERPFITMATSLIEMRMYRGISPDILQDLFMVIKYRFEDQGCSMQVEKDLGAKVFENVYFSGRGSLKVIQDLEPYINERVSCP